MENINEEMKDIRDKKLQVQIDHDGKKLWINTEKGCVFRAQNISELQIIDDRDKPITREKADITTLLGFLDANKWVNAIKEHGVDKEHAFTLIEEQERAYSGELLKEVKEQLNE